MLLNEMINLENATTKLINTANNGTAKNLDKATKKFQEKSKKD